MYFYIITSFVILCLLYICKYHFCVNGKHIVGKDICEVLIFLIFLFTMALRGVNVGVDTRTYSNIYTIIGSSSSLTDALKQAPLSAPFYVVLCRVLSYISLNPQLLIMVSSLFINIGLFIFLNRISIDPAFSAFCWLGLTLFYSSMNGSRQCMALVVVLNSLVYLSENMKDIKGWGLFVVAVGIHSTAMICLLAVLGIILADRTRGYRNLFIASVFVCIIISLLYTKLIAWFIKIFPWYHMYIDGKSSYSIFKGTGGGRIVLLYFFLFCIICFWIYFDLKNTSDKEAFHRKMIPSVVFCTIFGAFNCKNELINRMLWYYLALFITFIPSLLQKCHGKWRFCLKTGIILVLLTYSFLSLKENHNGVVPYCVFF